MKKACVRLLVAGFTFVLLSETFAQSNSWAKFRGPDENGISPEKGINKDWQKTPPKELWRMGLTDNGHSIPAIADGKVFVLDHKDDTDIVKALELQTGKPLWVYKYKDAKRQKWGFTRIIPVYENGNLYTLSRLGKLICFDADKGTVKWQRDFMKAFNSREPRWGFTGTPVIDGEKLIVAPQAPGAMIVALNKKTGKTIWQGGGDINTGYSTPAIAVIDGVRQYLFANKYGLAGIAAKDGKVLWKVPFETRHGNNIATPILFNNNYIFLTAGYNHGCATFKVKDNKVTKVWENGALKAHFNTPVLVKELIYGIGDPGKLMCLDPISGKVLWEKRGFGKGGLLVVDGTIIAIDGKSGQVIMAKLTRDNYVELGRISPLTKDKLSWVPPVVADKKLLVRNRSELVCLDLSEKSDTAKAK